METLSYYLALWRTPGIGPAAFFKIVKHFPDISVVFQTQTRSVDFMPLALSSEALTGLRQPDWKGVERDLAWLAQSPDHHIVSWQDTAYPPLLREISAPPPLLFIHGSASLLGMPQVAIVGSRHATQSGSALAKQFACALSEAGFTITSGLALGIDAASHQGALAGSGLTIGVMGTGVDSIYPARHRALAHAIIDKGALVSELPTGVGPQSVHFPRRNRIISGLSTGVLVVEAAVGSGSLITARYANEQGREVFAIPGSIHQPLVKGCHALIRQGAKLVESVDDMLEELGGLVQFAQIPPDPPFAKGGDLLSPEYTTLLDSIDFASTSMDTVIQRTGLTASQVSSMLSILELQGCIHAVPGGYSR